MPRLLGRIPDFQAETEKRLVTLLFEGIGVGFRGCLQQKNSTRPIGEVQGLLMPEMVITTSSKENCRHYYLELPHLILERLQPHQQAG